VYTSFPEIAHNEKPPFKVHLTADRSDRVYRDGEDVRLTITSEQAGTLYLFRCDPDGTVVCLCPSKSHPGARIQAGQEVHLPAKGSLIELETERGGGPRVFKAIVTREPLEALPLGSLQGEERKVLGTGQAALDRMTALDEELRRRAGTWSSADINVFAGRKTIGVCIGVGSLISPSAAHDAERMAALLEQRGMVARTFTLVNKGAGLRPLTKLFTQELSDCTRPGDTIILYWSGDAGMPPEAATTSPDRPQPYLTPGGGDLQRPQETMLLVNRLAGYLRALGDRRVLIVLDTDSAGGVAEELLQPHVSILAGCTKTQHPLTEVRTGGHRLFTRVLLQHLERSRGELEPGAAHQFVKVRLAELLEKEGLGDLQTPVLFSLAPENKGAGK
jgi:hypothetical protein